MSKASIDTFRQAIRATHGADAELVAQVAVHERFQGETMWEGTVWVFDLIDHPEAERCYCWQAEGGRITCVLGVGPIDSPAQAVRASFLADAEAEASG